MRVTLLAAIMIGISATAAWAQPSKMNPLPSGTDAAPGEVAAMGPVAPIVEVRVVEPIDGGNAALSEIKPQAIIAGVKAKTARIEPIRSVDARLLKIALAGSTPTPITGADTEPRSIDFPLSKATQVARADTQPSKMNPEISPVLPVVYVSLQPGKMNPAAAGLTGAMRYADSPWLEHAINDLGTNPTGWKRLWCARSINLWLQQSGKRGCGGDTAISCLDAGRKLEGPRIGAIAVLKHHVGIVKEIADRHVVLVSGNNRGRPGARTVGVSKYARASVVGYVWPE